LVVINYSVMVIINNEHNNIQMTQTIVNIVYAEATAIVVICIVIYLMYFNNRK